MANSITATGTTTSLLSRAALHVPKTSAGVSSSSPVLGLPAIAKKGRVSCSMEEGKQSSRVEEMVKGVSASSLMALATMSTSPAAMALVDERMTTEGTGLPFGLSNNLLGWILFGVFGLIWALYIIYAGSLEEDEESGLSL